MYAQAKKLFFKSISRLYKAHPKIMRIDGISRLRESIETIERIAPNTTRIPGILRNVSMLLGAER